ncbi:MAG: HAMP domain-containing histidine kinase [Tannerella sp.]|jgi:signal transduction histidine kinase|nr:HAMP domain-containing histidine kinase [Tannerella sp.]
MKIQTRLSLISSVVFGIVFAAISALIYGSFYRNAEKKTFHELEKTVCPTALFYLEEDELNKDEYSHIKVRFQQLVSNTYYQIYNESDSICYGSKIARIPHQTLNLIRTKEKLAFKAGGFFCFGIFYRDNQGDFVVISKERESELKEQLNLLLGILLLAFVIGIVLIVSISKLLAYMAYRPFRNVIDQVNNLSTHNLNVKIESAGTKDELQDLIDTFNDLLSKISETFVIQKNFVRYVSHEFKTPLASLLGNLEVFAMKDRTPEEYGQISQKMIQEITQLQEILDALIVISDLGETAETTTAFRIDELIWQIIHRITARYRQSKIRIHMDIPPESEQLLTSNKNRTQLLMAFYNLIENAVKYSKGNSVEIFINRINGRLRIAIKDNGIGIPSGQLKHISRPFYRADNTSQIQGSGIGLSIALRILEKNRIEYQIQSDTNKGTTVTLFL